MGTWAGWRLTTLVAIALALVGFLSAAAAQSTHIQTEYLMTLYAPLQPTQVVNTDFFIVSLRDGGYVEGPQIKGKLLQPGGDWLRRLPNGTFRLDVRLTIQTDDNALIYVEYGGVLQYSKEAAARLDKGEALGADEAYFITTPRFQTTAERYAWLNNVQAVGRMVSFKRGGHVKYEIFVVR